MMKWISVDSSRIDAVAWEDRTTYIRFKDGAIYAYSGVSEAQHRAFMSSSSLGSALNDFQSYHPYRRIN